MRRHGDVREHGECSELCGNSECLGKYIWVELLARGETEEVQRLDH